MARTRTRKNNKKGGGEGTERKARIAAIKLARETKKARESSPTRDAREEIESLEKRLDREEHGETFGFPDNTSKRHRRIVAHLKPFHPIKWSIPSVKAKQTSIKQKKTSRLHRLKKWFKGTKGKTIKLFKRKSHGKVVSNSLLDESVSVDSQFKNYDASPRGSISKKYSV